MNPQNVSTRFSTQISTIMIPGEDSDTFLTTGIFAVIPANNEAQTIGSVVLSTRRYVHTVIVVDDGSTDTTLEIARSAGAEMIRLDQSMGRVSALLLGLQRAREMNCTIAVCIDAGGQFDPREIGRVTEKIASGEADLVIGSRYLNRDSRQLAYEKFNQVRLGSGTVVTDLTSSFQAFSRKALDNLDFPMDGFMLNRDLLAFFDRKGLNIAEVPVTNDGQPVNHISWGYPIKVLAGMPAYNEEKYIAGTLAGAQKYVDRVVVVDDGSTDKTAEIAEKMGAIVVRHAKNSGYGAALRSIFEKARDLHVDALVIIDSDGQHDPHEIEILVERLGQGDADVVIGSRFIGKKQEIPKYRIFGMKVLDRFSKAAGACINSDSQSGFRAYNKRAIDAIRIYGNGMSAGSEILIQIAEHHLKTADVPISVRYDTGDTSTQNPINHGILIVYNLIGMISYRRPLPAFGIPGSLFVFAGLLTGYAAFSEYSTTTKFPFVLWMATEMFLVMGLFLIIAALILNYLVVFVKQQKEKLS